MPDIKLKIDDLILDHDNPRIPHADGQQDALQKVIRDQRNKLVALAESIVDKGLNPMDRLLVLRLNQRPERFISLEGNRRVAVFKLLTSPAVMTGLEMPSGMKRQLQRLAEKFKKSLVEPISCFELPSRDDSKYWLDLRHNIGHEGAGIEDWKTLAKRRAEGKTPVVLQALELVTERAGLTAAERAAITESFPISTFERILENRSARRELGLDVVDGNLVTRLPADEVAKPLKKIVLDLAMKKTRVNRLMKTEDMMNYLRTDLGSAYLPDLSKARAKARTLDQIPVSEFTKVRRTPTRRKRDPSDRKTVVPRNCALNVTQNRIADIYKELRTVELEDAPNGIAVLLRVFLELSVDHFLVKHGGEVEFVPPGTSRKKFKTLDEKLAEVVAIMVTMNVAKSKFAAIKRAVTVKTSPMHTDLLHRYVHDQYQTPAPNDLKAAWDQAQPLFECIWP
ncbi:MAG: hypothetical protein WD044_10840 [Dongiaceae bacterium]